MHQASEIALTLVPRDPVRGRDLPKATRLVSGKGLHHTPVSRLPQPRHRTGQTWPLGPSAECVGDCLSLLTLGLTLGNVASASLAHGRRPSRLPATSLPATSPSQPRAVRPISPSSQTSSGRPLREAHGNGPGRPCCGPGRGRRRVCRWHAARGREELFVPASLPRRSGAT